MNICVISGLYATEKSPYGGIFVYEHLKQLRNHGLSYKTYIIKRDYLYGVALIYRIVKKTTLHNSTLISWDKSEPIIPVICPVNIFDMILYIFFPKQYFKTILKKITDDIEIKSDTIIHAHWTYPEGYYTVQLAKKYHVPCDVTAHGSDIHTIPKKNRIIKKYTLKTLESADKVIFVSNALLTSAKELGYSGKNAVIISNGIDPTYFYPIEKECAIQKTGWSQSKKYVVGFVGNLIYVKRADKFVKIFSEIQKIVGDVEFVLVGDGDLRDVIQKDCNEIGLTVTFAGRVPHVDVVNWMNLFDVMILPSRNEGWPCVVLEAYACGVPVVGSNNGGIAEAIGGMGVVVDDGEGFEERFAKGVCDVLMGVHPTDSSELVKHAAKYTWESLVSMEIDVYTSLMDREISGDEN